MSHHILYPIRPPSIEGISADDPGVASPADSPIPLSGDQDIAEPEDETEIEEEGGCIRIGKGYGEPQEPTAAMINRHNLTHLPYRSWCPHCVAARRNNASHFSGSTTRQKPLLVADYCLISDTKTEDKLTNLVARVYPPKDNAPKALFSVVCETKGAHDDYTVGRLCQLLRECGVRDFIYKTDRRLRWLRL